MKISIIVASYNYEQYLRETLDSILAQTWSDWEALIIDDGSTDHSVEVIQEYVGKDNRIKLLRHLDGTNKGLAKTVQLGVLEATGDWIAFCESDDWWEPDFLQDIVETIQQFDQYGVLFSDVFLEGKSETMDQHCSMVREHFQRGGHALSLYQNMINAVPTFSCGVVRKDLLEYCDFHPYFPPSLDMWLWCQLVTKTEFYFINKMLVHWRQHEESYMKKEVLPNQLNVKNVEEFHFRMRELLNKNESTINNNREKYYYVEWKEWQVKAFNFIIRLVSMLILCKKNRKRFRRFYSVKNNFI